MDHKLNSITIYMWTTESLWFEIAIVSMIYAFGNILMGHFEERTPKIRRVGKYILTLLVVCGISVYPGRAWGNKIFLAHFHSSSDYMCMAMSCPGKRESMAGRANPKANTMIFGNGIRIFSQSEPFI